MIGVPPLFETNNNYKYDRLCNLTQDTKEEIANIVWTVTGKVKQIIRTPTSSKNSLAFDYDAMGNRNLFIANYKLASAKTHTGLQNPRLNDQSPARLKCHSDGGRPREFYATQPVRVANRARMGDGGCGNFILKK